MDGNTLLSFEQFSALDESSKYLNYVREYNSKTEAKASLATAEAYGLTRERKARRGLELPGGFCDMERLDQSMIVVMLRQVEKAINNNSPDVTNLVYNLKEECKAKRVNFDELKKYASDDLIIATLNLLSRNELCKAYALMADLLSEVPPIDRITLKTMPLAHNDEPTPMQNIYIKERALEPVTETRYHKHSASFASLGELHTLQHLDVMSNELAVYNLGIAGTMFDCMYKDDNGKMTSCSSISNWNSGVSFCSLMPRMSANDTVHTIVRRLAGIPTTAHLCTDSEIKHVPYHVGRAITYMLSNYAIAAWNIGFDEIGAPVFYFEGVADKKPIPASCCARPRPVKEQKRMDNNIGKRHYHTWRFTGNATGCTSTPTDCTVQGRKPKGKKKFRNNHKKFANYEQTTPYKSQVVQYDAIRNPHMAHGISSSAQMPFSVAYPAPLSPPINNIAQMPPPAVYPSAIPTPVNAPIDQRISGEVIITSQAFAGMNLNVF